MLFRSTYVTKALVKGSAGAVKSGTAKAVKGVGSTITGTADVVGSGAKSVGRSIKGTARSVVHGVDKGVDTAKDVAKNVAGRTLDKAKVIGRDVLQVTAGAKSAAIKVAQAGKKTVRNLGDKLKRLKRRKKPQ